MKRLVSRKDSTLIHLLPGQLPSHPDLALQLRDHGTIALHPARLTRVVRQPLPKPRIQRGPLRPGPGPGGLDELLVRTQGDVFHAYPRLLYTRLVYTRIVAAAGVSTTTRSWCDGEHHGEETAGHSWRP